MERLRRGFRLLGRRLGSIRVNKLKQKLLILNQKLRSIKIHNKARLIIIIIGVVFFIIPYILVPSINSDLIWTSPEPSDGLDMYLFSEINWCSLPNNDLILNRYDIIVYTYPDPSNSTHSITFIHEGTGLEYVFNYTLTIEEYQNGVNFKMTTLTMIPGQYRVYREFLVQCLLWEHGFIAPYSEWLFYLVSVLILTAILLIGNIIVHILKLRDHLRKISLFEKMQN